MSEEIKLGRVVKRIEEGKVIQRFWPSELERLAGHVTQYNQVNILRRNRIIEITRGNFM